MAQNPMLSLVYIGTYLRKIKFDSDENLQVSTHYNGVYITTKSGHYISSLKINGIDLDDGLL